MNPCHRRRYYYVITVLYDFWNKKIILFCQRHSIIAPFTMPILGMIRSCSLNNMLMVLFRVANHFQNIFKGNSLS